MDLESLLRVIGRKEAIENMKMDAMNKLKNNRATVDKMTQGKVTFAGLLKNKAGKAQTTQNLLTEIS